MPIQIADSTELHTDTDTSALFRSYKRTRRNASTKVRFFSRNISRHCTRTYYRLCQCSSEGCFISQSYSTVIVCRDSPHRLLHVSQVLCEGSFDSVVGLGGGSSIDTAKAIAVLACNDVGHLRELKVPAEPRSALPIIAIPTTAGTGQATHSPSAFTSVD